MKQMFCQKFKHRSTEIELLDNLEITPMTLPLMKQNLKEFEKINKKFGTVKVLLEGLNKIYKKNKNRLTINRVSIADLGCGAGDLTRVIYRWAIKKALKVTIKGLDINPHIIEYAMAQDAVNPNSLGKVGDNAIRFEVLDILSDKLKTESYDIVCLNNVCHHMDTSQLKNCLKNFTEMTRVAILINDLQRHCLPYYFIKWMTRIFNYSKLAQNDGPVSVLRAFSKHELLEIVQSCQKNAHITDYEINWKWPFRWQVILYKFS